MSMQETEKVCALREALLAEHRAEKVRRIAPKDRAVKLNKLFRQRMTASRIIRRASLLNRGR